MTQLSIQEIRELLLHRYPFLLVDRVVEVSPGEFIRGYKNVSVNEPCFTGHFPEQPIMPGVLILEAMAQLGIVFAKKTASKDLENRLLVFAGMDNVRFKRQVIPGDRLDMELHLIKVKRTIWKMEGRAEVDGSLAASATLMAAVAG